MAKRKNLEAVGGRLSSSDRLFYLSKLLKNKPDSEPSNLNDSSMTMTVTYGDSGRRNQ